MRVLESTLMWSAEILLWLLVEKNRLLYYSTIWLFDNDVVFGNDGVRISGGPTKILEKKGRRTRINLNANWKQFCVQLNEIELLIHCGKKVLKKERKKKERTKEGKKSVQDCTRFLAPNVKTFCLM